MGKQDRYAVPAPLTTNDRLQVDCDVRRDSAARPSRDQRGAVRGDRATLQNVGAARSKRLRRSRR